MREPPANLPDATLVACIRAAYGRAVADIQFLPLGHDASAWVYHLETDDCAASFLKVRRGAVNAAGLSIPRHLYERGIRQVVAPFPTLGGALWTEAGGYALVLYPFVAGRTGMEAGLSDDRWREYGATLREVHATQVPPDLARVVRRESFRPAGADQIRRLDAHIDAGVFEDEPARALATAWRSRREEIRLLLDRADDLGRRLERAAPPSVLCHADAHTANVLAAEHGGIRIVDWDETVLAPRERDLMFVVGGGIIGGLVGPREEALFFEGYGRVDVDPLALAYYRYAWAVADVGAYGEEVLLRPDLGPADRREGAERFASLFAPGNIVGLAFASESDAPGQRDS